MNPFPSPASSPDHSLQDPSPNPTSTQVFFQDYPPVPGMDTKAVRSLYCPDLRVVISDSHTLEVRYV